MPSKKSSNELKEQLVVVATSPSNDSNSVTHQEAMRVRLYDMCCVAVEKLNPHWSKKSVATFAANMAVNMEVLFAAFMFIAINQSTKLMVGDVDGEKMARFVEGAILALSAVLATSNLGSDIFTTDAATEASDLVADQDPEKVEAKRQLALDKLNLGQSLTIKEKLLVMETNDPDKFAVFNRRFLINYALCMSAQWVLGGLADVLAPAQLIDLMPMPQAVGITLKILIALGVTGCGTIYYNMFSVDDVKEITLAAQETSWADAFKEITRDPWIGGEFLTELTLGVINRSAAFAFIPYTLLTAVVGMQPSHWLVLGSSLADFIACLYVTPLTRAGAMYSNIIRGEDNRVLIETTKQTIADSPDTNLAKQSSLTYPEEFAPFIMSLIRGGATAGLIMSLLEELSTMNMVIALVIGAVIFGVTLVPVRRIAQEDKILLLANGDKSATSQTLGLMTNRSTVEQRAAMHEKDCLVKNIATGLSLGGRVGRWIAGIAYFNTLAELSLTMGLINAMPDRKVLLCLNALFGTFAAVIDGHTFTKKNIHYLAVHIARYSALSDVAANDKRIAQLTSELEAALGDISTETQNVIHSVRDSENGYHDENSLSALESGQREVVDTAMLLRQKPAPLRHSFWTKLRTVPVSQINRALHDGHAYIEKLEEAKVREGARPSFDPAGRESMFNALPLAKKV